MAGPNVLIIGAARSGTTALTEMFRRHPEFSVAEPKEVHFFAHHGAELSYCGPGDQETIQQRIVVDPARLEDCFRGDARFRLEGSVSTLYRPQVSIENIRRFASEDVKLLALLREPAARALSAYRYLRHRGYEPESAFGRGLALESTRRQDGYHHMWHYRGMSRYRLQLEPFLAAFPGRVHIGIFEEFVEDMAASMESILGFLGARTEVGIQPVGMVNGGGEVRSIAVQRAMRLVRSKPQLLAAVRAVTTTGARERVRGANLSSQPEVLPHELFELYDEFSGDRTYVEGLLGREITAWRRP